MNKHHKSTVIPSSVCDSIHRKDYFEETCHYHRNNHNNDFIEYDEISKTINNIPSRKRRNEYNYRSNKKFSLIKISINNILLIFIRLMILFIIVLFISLIFYYFINYFYSKPNKSQWQKIIHWFYYEE